MWLHHSVWFVDEFGHWRCIVPCVPYDFHHLGIPALDFVIKKDELANHCHCQFSIGLTKAPWWRQTSDSGETGCLCNAQNHALIHHKAQTMKKLCKAISTSPLSFIIHLFPNRLVKYSCQTPGSSSAGSTLRIQQNAVFGHTFAEAAEAEARPPAPSQELIPDASLTFSVDQNGSNCCSLTRRLQQVPRNNRDKATFVLPGSEECNFQAPRVFAEARGGSWATVLAHRRSWPKGQLMTGWAAMIIHIDMEKEIDIDTDIDVDVHAHTHKPTHTHIHVYTSTHLRIHAYISIW
jgi:hypothetical protein